MATDFAASWEQLSARLRAREEIRFAIAYGSALAGGPSNDLDIAVMVDRDRIPPEADLDFEVALAAALAPATQLPLDVRVINDAPLPFRYNVSRGRAMAARDRSALAEFLERTWDEYHDFAPVARQYLMDLG